ncbi:hypothetical protein KAU18_04440, partial [Candidatus Bathyarchaeota archaeon]|nr:hypothetical protein [Candidatus Bathyarchaeota archaeon]
GKSMSEDIAAYVNDDELKKWFLKVLPRISLGEPRPESAALLRKRIEKLEQFKEETELRLSRLTVWQRKIEEG